MHPRIPLAFLAARAHCWLMVSLSSSATCPDRAGGCCAWWRRWQRKEGRREFPRAPALDRHCWQPSQGWKQAVMFREWGGVLRGLGLRPLLWTAVKGTLVQKHQQLCCTTLSGILYNKHVKLPALTNGVKNTGSKGDASGCCSTGEWNLKCVCSSSGLCVGAMKPKRIS